MSGGASECPVPIVRVRKDAIIRMRKECERRYRKITREDATTRVLMSSKDATP